MRGFLDEVGDGFSAENWASWTGTASKAYALFADLIGARREEVVGIPNTSVGTGLAAHMVDPKPGANLVLDDLEYQTVFPFTLREKAGVEMRVVKSLDGFVDGGELASRVDDRTSAVVVSAVSCWNGYRYDLRELSEAAHAHGAYLVVDAAQQVGAVRMDVKRDGVDFLSTCGHKWLLAPPGTGFLYVSEALIERFDPVLPGWMSVTERSGDDVWRPEYPKTAQRFETGMANFMLLAAARAGLELVHRFGVANVEREILKRSGYLLEKLEGLGVKVCTPLEKQHRAGLVTFLLKRHAELYSALLKNSVVAYHHPENVVRNLSWPTGGLRVDPTFFNTFDELDELLSFVKKYA